MWLQPEEADQGHFFTRFQVALYYAFQAFQVVETLRATEITKQTIHDRANRRINQLFQGQLILVLGVK